MRLRERRIGWRGRRDEDSARAQYSKGARPSANLEQPPEPVFQVPGVSEPAVFDGVELVIRHVKHLLGGSDSDQSPR